MGHKERIEYVISECKGESIYIGKSVNYSVCCSGKSLDDLRKKITDMIHMWLKLGTDTMQQPEPLEMKEITSEEWAMRYTGLESSEWRLIADALYAAVSHGKYMNNPALEKAKIDYEAAKGNL